MPRACKRCGQCCENISLPFNQEGLKDALEAQPEIGDSTSDHQKQYVADMKLMLEIFEFTGETVDPGNDNTRWKATCKMYVAPDNGNKAKCLCQDNKPLCCSRYPYGRKIIDTCGYKGRTIVTK